MTDIREEKLAQEIKASLVDGYLPCPVAFKLAERLKLARNKVGSAANQLKIRIVNCQLGCFAIEKTPAKETESRDVDMTLAQQIKTSLVTGRLPCASAFTISRQLEINPGQVSDAANQIKVKISSCQLGCF